VLLVWKAEVAGEEVQERQMRWRWMVAVGSVCGGPAHLAEQASRRPVAAAARTRRAGSSCGGLSSDVPPAGETVWRHGDASEPTASTAPPAGLSSMAACR
jgi:hypothetical protein